MVDHGSEDPSGESALVERCRQGDERGWEQLVSLHGGLIRSIIRWERWGFPASAFDDLLQETLLALVRGVRMFRRECSLKTFVHRVTVKTCLHHRRRLYAERRRPTREIADAMDRIDVAADPDAMDPLANVSQADLVANLRRAFESLEEPCRRVIDFRYYQGMSYAEMAESLDMPLGSVGVKLGRCLGRLRELMRGAGGL